MPLVDAIMHQLTATKLQPEIETCNRKWKLSSNFFTTRILEAAQLRNKNAHICCSAGIFRLQVRTHQSAPHTIAHG